PIAAARPAALDRNAFIAEILERPVFSPDRVPHEETAANEAEPEESGPPQLQSRLTGIMIGPTGREALFERDDGEFAGVKEGAEMEGWKVKAIRAAKVVLPSQAGDDQLVKLTDTESEGAAPARPAKKKRAAIRASAKNQSRQRQIRHLSKHRRPGNR